MQMLENAYPPLAANQEKYAEKSPVTSSLSNTHPSIPTYPTRNLSALHCSVEQPHDNHQAAA